MRRDRHSAESAPRRERRHGGEVGLRHTETGRQVVAHVRGDVPHPGGQPCLRDVDLVVRRGERAHVAGPNGAGKTSLLTALLHVLDDTDEHVAVLPQELDEAAELDTVRALDPLSRGRVFGTVANLGIDPDRLLVTDAPSPGEARTLALARLLASNATVLLLDEPVASRGWCNGDTGRGSCWSR